MSSRLKGFIVGSVSLILPLFFVPLFAQEGEEEVPYDYVPDVTYEEMEDRLACLESSIPLHFNQRIKDFIDYFTIRNREYTRDIVARKDIYFSIFEKYLEKYDLPDELKYLAIVESGLRPNAVSHANAVGLWQFISSTGRIYGLRGDWYMDDRMDPYEATDAACRHLKDLYNMFGSWELALAAYNCGPGNVRKAIRRSDYRRNFWEIYRYLPRETRSYVPQFVAMVYTMNNYELHNLFPYEEQYLPAYDTIMVSQYFHLETFASQLNLCVDDLLALNPRIKRGALPEGTRDFALRIPADLKDTVVSQRSFLYDTASKVGKEHLEYLARNMPGSTYGRQRVVYRVRSGDVLGTIAQRHHVRVTDIKEWNNLRSNLIRVGQRLNIWVLPTYSSQTSGLYASNTTTPKATPKPKPQPVANGSTYTVQSGDTLWDISRANNVSIEQLKKLNNLTSSRITPGQSLVVRSD